MRKSLFTKRGFWNLFLLIIFVALAGSVYYFYSQYQKTQKMLLNPDAAAREETTKVTNELRAFMELPKETPTIATIVDKNKLKDQPFFANAEPGDKIIIYAKTAVAILYRPSTHKIINLAPINLGASTTPTVPQIRVALYNGTETTALTKTVEQDIKTKVTNVTIVDKENAVNTDYTKTLVIDISGTHGEQAKQLAQLLNATVSKLPADEKKPTDNADLLVIIGKDYKTP